jgi:hypothetical protein
MHTFTGTMHTFTGTMHTFTRTMHTRSPGLCTHSLGLCTHSLGLCTHSLGLCTHSLGLCTHIHWDYAHTFTGTMHTRSLGLCTHVHWDYALQTSLLVCVARNRTEQPPSYAKQTNLLRLRQTRLLQRVGRPSQMCVLQQTHVTILV